MIVYYLNMQTANSIEGNSDAVNVSETPDSKPAKLETDPSVQSDDPNTISESEGRTN